MDDLYMSCVNCKRIISLKQTEDCDSFGTGGGRFMPQDELLHHREYQGICSGRGAKTQIVSYTEKKS